MDYVETPLLEIESVSGATTISPSAEVAAESAVQTDLELQEQLIRDITSDDLQVLRKIGFKTVLKPHQKVLL
jgi:hypothetical protein